MARSYDPLARRLCKALYDLADGDLSKSIPLDVVATEVNVSNEELMAGAVSHAQQEGWLMASGLPAHSVHLTAAGQQIAARAKWRPTAATRATGFKAKPGRTKQNSLKLRSR